MESNAMLVEDRLLNDVKLYDTSMCMAGLPFRCMSTMSQLHTSSCFFVYEELRHHSLSSHNKKTCSRGLISVVVLIVQLCQERDRN